MNKLLTTVLLSIIFIKSFGVSVNEVNNLDDRSILHVSYKIIPDEIASNADLKSLDFEHFNYEKEDKLNLGHIKQGHVLFVYFKILNNARESNYTVSFGNNQVEHVEFWSISPEKTLLEKSKFIHPVNIYNAKRQGEYLLKVKDTKNNIILVPTIIGTKSHEKISYIKNILDGLFYGGLLFIILYNFILFLNFTKNRYLLYYTLYVLFFGLFLFAFDGYLIKLVPEYSPDLHTFLINSGVFCAYAFNILFLMHFLEAKQYFPKFNTYLRILSFLLFGITLLSFIEIIRNFFLGSIDFIAPVCMLSVIWFAFLSWRNKVKYAYLIVFSYLWIIVSGLFMILVYNGVLPGYEYKEYILKIGLYGELVILSFAASFSIFKQQVFLRQRVSAELENSKRINTELQDAKKEVERVSGIKDRFMINISHELRTPMNAVLGFTNLLENEVEDTETAETVKNLKVSAYGLMNAVEDILDFKQLTNEDLVSTDVTFNLYKSIEYSISSYKFEANSRNINFDLKISEEANNFFNADKQKINKLISILIQNALKFTKRGSIGFELDPVEKTNEGILFRFTVSDTGIGIPKDELDNVFNSFTQVNEGYTRDYGGTGMGLALFKLILQFLGGEHHVVSDVNAGSVFSFKLFVPYSSVNASNRINVAQESTTAELLKANILLVEDDPVNITIATKYLNLISDEIKIDVAENGEEAIDFISNNEVDIILMDIQMPTMDGYEATRIIRNELNMHELPIVAVTAHALEEEREKCFESGMTDFLAKPYSKDQLENVILRNINDDDQAYTRQLENLY